MSIVLTASITGLKQIRKRLDKANDDYRQALAAGIYEEGFAIMAESVKECPVKYGFLKGSAYNAPPNPRDTYPIGEIGYGQEYGPAVHDVPAPHRVGKWQYLADPLKRAQSGYTRRVQKRTQKMLRTGTRIGGVGGDLPKRPNNNRKVK